MAGPGAAGAGRRYGPRPRLGTRKRTLHVGQPGPARGPRPRSAGSTVPLSSGAGAAGFPLHTVTLDPTRERPPQSETAARVRSAE